VPILVRLQPVLLSKLDEWINNSDGSLTRPAAIRRLIEIALATKSKKQRR
jgi:hypothetical protein